MGNIVDLSGKQFGRLTVLSLTDKRDHRSTVWRCQCSCGKIVDVVSTSLIHGRTQSCGCLHMDQLKKTSNRIVSSREKDRLLKTDVKRLSTAPSAANTSGVVGVSYDKSKGKWVAYIYFMGKRHCLGTTSDKEKAIALRREAEQKLHGEFLEWYYSEHPEKKPEAPPPD